MLENISLPNLHLSGLQPSQNDLILRKINLVSISVNKTVHIDKFFNYYINDNYSGSN